MGLPSPSGPGEVENTHLDPIGSPNLGHGLTYYIAPKRPNYISVLLNVQRVRLKAIQKTGAELVIYKIPNQSESIKILSPIFPASSLHFHGIGACIV